MKKSFAVSRVALFAALGLALAIHSATAQPQPGGGDPQTERSRGGDRGGDRGRFDPARMREMMGERIKETIGATDEEWKAIQPLVNDVMEKQAATRMMRFGGMRGPGGDRGGDRSGMSPSNPAAEALEKAIEGKDAKEIEAKLKALREDRKVKEDALKQSRDKLRAVLTLKQEAQLVLMGLLD